MSFRDREKIHYRLFQSKKHYSPSKEKHEIAKMQKLLAETEVKPQKLPPGAADHILLSHVRGLWK